MLRQAIDRACGTLFFLIIAFSIYRFVTSPDPYKCGALLEGQWLEPVKQWQPPGCMIHKYRGDDLTGCLRGRLAFIGDSTAREVFWAAAEKLDAKRTTQAMYAADKHSNITFHRSGVELDFVWDPYLNSSSLDLHIRSIQRPVDEWNYNADIVLISGGLWHARHLGDLSTNDFGSAMERIMNSLRSVGQNFPFIQSFLSRQDSKGIVAIAPIRIPLNHSLSPDRAVTLTQNKINPMNDYLRHLSKDHGLPVIWSFAGMTQDQPSAFQKDGLHIVNEIATLQADVLLNLKCNAELSRQGHYPMDKTCCSAYTRPTWVQRAILISSIGVFPLLMLVTAKEHRRLAFLPSKTVSYALTVLGLAVWYSYFADRTQALDKVHKRCSSIDFRVMCLATLALGILSIRRSVQTVMVQGQISTTTKVDQPFLSRDQTDEWKGWMQFLILIYHYTGASKVLAVYKLIRVLVASYLFMTGFGHTAYFYQKRDFSLRRCAAVLLRINLLSCVLPYAMRTDYLFYYFAPLTSFWYLVVYFTMGLGRQSNGSLKFLCGKIVISAALVTTLVRVPGLLEVIFMFLGRSARIHWDVAEWRFRVTLDIYIVYVGMLSAVAFMKTPDSLQSASYHDASTVTLFKRLRTVAIIASIATIPTYWLAVASITEKAEYNSWMPYVSWLPILSFVVLRNCTWHLRNFHSSIFAWLGRYSLETFTLQFHIWLAADTKGILSLGLMRWEDFATITAVFLWISWRVGSATSIIVSWLLDSKANKREVEVDGSTSDMELPRTKSKDETSAHHQSDKVLMISASGMWALLRENLAARLVLMLMVLWLLNLVY